MTTNGFGLVHFESRETSLWVLKLEFWMAVFVLWLYSRFAEGGFLLWEEQRKKPLFYLVSPLLTLGGILVLLTALSVGKNLLGFHSHNEELNAVNSLLERNTAFFVFSALTAGITEELIFRGYLLPRMEMLGGNTWAAMVLSSLLFGLAHFTYGDLTRMAFPFIIGVIFSFHYARYRSITALIICHVLIDLVMI